MKKLVALFLTGALALCLVGCVEATSALRGKEKEQEENETKENTEVIVFAAASMTESLQELAKEYKEVEPRVRLTFNFDSSGTLKTQIEEGAQCDLFISAAQKQMDQLDKEGPREINTKSLDFVDSSTRVNLLENGVALVVPEGNPKNIKSFEDMAEKLKEKTMLLSIGNSDVPVGQYTKKIFQFFGLKEEDLGSSGVITYGTNVKEVTTQVKEGSVDAGIVYCTDAYSAELTIMEYATAEMCGQVIYPAAVMKNSDVAMEAADFLEYLQGPEASKIFERAGFSLVK